MSESRNLSQTISTSHSNSNESRPPQSSLSNLDSFIVNKRATPTPTATSQEVRDRGSIFVGTIYSATTPEQAKARLTHVKHIVHRAKRATHDMAAWRCMVLKGGRTGLGLGGQGDGGGGELDDFEVVQGFKDDGERWGGERILKVMKEYAIIDAVVVVSRWYGGTLLGPARFEHIETCAAEVCREFKKSEELRESLATLRSLDDMLAELRHQLGVSKPIDSATTPVVVAPAKQVEYKDMDITKVNRLIQARERSIQSVKAILAQKTTVTVDGQPTTDPDTTQSEAEPPKPVTPNLSKPGEG